MDVESHRRLRDALASELGPEEASGSLVPGCDFLPSLTTVWGYIPGDLLVIGTGSAIVSDSVAELFQRSGLSGARFFPATVLSVADATSQSEVNSVVKQQFSAELSASELGGYVISEPYHELVVTADSKPIWETQVRCASCGSIGYTAGKMLMHSHQWSGDDIFTLSPTRSIGVTEVVKREIDQRGLKGFLFDDITAD